MVGPTPVRGTRTTVVTVVRTSTPSDTVVMSTSLPPVPHRVPASDRYPHGRHVSLVGRRVLRDLSRGSTTTQCLWSSPDLSSLNPRTPTPCVGRYKGLQRALVTLPVRSGILDPGNTGLGSFCTPFTLGDIQVPGSTGVREGPGWPHRDVSDRPGRRT